VITTWQIMVPVLWDTGGAISRKEPYAPSDEVTGIPQKIKDPAATPRPSAKPFCNMRADTASPFYEQTILT